MVGMGQFVKEDMKNLRCVPVYSVQLQKGVWKMPYFVFAFTIVSIKKCPDFCEMLQQFLQGYPDEVGRSGDWEIQDPDFMLFITKKCYSQAIICSMLTSQIFCELLYCMADFFWKDK